MSARKATRQPKARQSNVIPFPVKNARAALSPVVTRFDEHVPIWFPPDISLTTLGFALQCMSLQMESGNTDGKLVVQHMAPEAQP